MTIKELAYSVQQCLETSTGCSFKRAHIYEFLAASFGYKSYAALGSDVDIVLTELGQRNRPAAVERELIKRRITELGYQQDIADFATSALETFLAERRIDIARISSLVRLLRNERSTFDSDRDYDWEDPLLTDGEYVFGHIMLDGLNAAAVKGNALAHYALALIYALDDESSDNVGSSYWYSQAQKGVVLAGVQKEWADAHKAHLARTEKFERHLKEAGRLGNHDALLDLAVRFGDTSFFDKQCDDVDTDPTTVAHIAKCLGRTADIKKWLTLAAESGDTDAMLTLIEEYDHSDLLRCWTWVYLSKLVGTDLTQSEYYLINEDGSDYDDDAGGPCDVTGRDGVDLKSLTPEEDAIARLTAQKLHEQIRLNSR